jgi:uncharacterized damage-inducible protein DinB
MPEAWLNGPVSDVDGYLQPVAHSLLQAREDLPHIAAGLTADELWERPGGAASLGFHLLHAAGSLDRLFTYARGEVLTAEQRQALSDESEALRDQDPDALAAYVVAAIERALVQLRATPREILLEPRKVGRKGLPSTVLGLLFHGAEHTMRHVGQAIATGKVVRAASAA